ncbi:hypothetical protein V1523DRAFT_422113 [Lipomyces doorenjongii]
MLRQFGVPLEILDAPAYMSEFGYNGDIDGIIEPFQLKSNAQTKSFKDWSKDTDWKEVLDSGRAEFRSMKK